MLTKQTLKMHEVLGNDIQARCSQIANMVDAIAGQLSRYNQIADAYNEIDKAPSDHLKIHASEMTKSPDNTRAYLLKGMDQDMQDIMRVIETDKVQLHTLLTKTPLIYQSYSG